MPQALGVHPLYSCELFSKHFLNNSRRLQLLAVTLKHLCDLLIQLWKILFACLGQHDSVIKVVSGVQS